MSSLTERWKDRVAFFHLISNRNKMNENWNEPFGDLSQCNCLNEILGKKRVNKKKNERKKNILIVF
jgi:hypothetical protein